MKISVETLPAALKRLISMLALAGAFVPIAHAQDVIKANNTTNLNLAGSWGSGGPPASGNVAVWDNTVTGANTTVLGGDLSWQGIRIANPGGTVTINTGNTLTLGSAGIDMTAATANFNLNPSLVLGAPQTWSVATGRVVSANGATVDNGGNLLSVSNNGSVNFSGNLTGSGGLTMTQAATSSTNITGNSTYTGTTTINGGFFTLGANGSISGSTQITGSSSGTFRLNQNNDSTLNNTITGAIALQKLGTGTTTLTGTNNYTGSTTISAGTLLVNTTNTGSEMRVNGGTLGGGDTVGTVLFNYFNSGGGTLAPGATAGATGILNTGNINLGHSGGTLPDGSVTLAMQLNGLMAGTGYDQVNTVGTVTLDDTITTLSLTLGFTPTVGDAFTIINNDGTDAITGSFIGLAEGATFTVDTTQFEISYLGGTGNDVVLTTVIPEPSSFALLTLGLLGLLVVQRVVSRNRRLV
jgi:autotransporter-associated beta strand protein